MVNTLAGSYNTSEMVVTRNLRLPELDKNRNVDQQKALVFESKTCKYDVILGADFLTKTGIDVKYSTRTIEWFDNELPLRDPYSLTNRDTLAMAEILEIQQEVELYDMDWYTFRSDLSRTTKNTTIKTSDNDSPAHVTVSGFTGNKTI